MLKPLFSFSLSLSLFLSPPPPPFYAPALSSSLPFQKLFGLSDEQMNLAIENARKEDAGEKITRNDVNAQADGDGFSLSQKVDVFVYASLFAALLYFGSRDFGNSAGRYFRIYFPREARALGITGDVNEEVWVNNERM